MAFEHKRHQLLGATAAALCLAAAAPAAAQTAESEKAETATAPAETEERLAPMAAGGKIRPFAGGILPNAGRIRTFAGDVVGTAGRIRTFQGDAEASAGEVKANAGRIRTFAGRIRTFTSEVTPQTGAGAFWGTLAPRAGTLSAAAGRIRTFDGDFEAMAGRIRTFAGRIRTFSGDLLGYEQATGAYRDLNGGFRELYEGTKATWGETIRQQTGRSFDDAFANRMFGKYGVDLNAPGDLEGINEVGVELFLLDWYDNLMMYSGRDQVDHWMKAINWSPALTQSLGNGADTKIGILDYGVSGDESGNNHVSWAGYQNGSNNHGSAVSSLIMAKHDGRGVMGIAPDVKVIGYNPFDSTDTAGWTDISQGVRYMLANGASVINASLGVPGQVLSSGWNDVFKDNWISAESKKRVFVLAAGNEGVTHRKDDLVNWNFDRNPNIIIVGSVDPDGVISNFSNRPGEGKFKKLGGNDPLGTDMLRDRFIVAPGEFMLVSDGQGGVTRMSGTSFAAPLVSGTIALVHDRWPWLADNPVDTVNLILNSTRDVGAPGTDNVYGRGMLDVQKALEPGNFWALQWKQNVNGVVKTTSAGTVLGTSQRTRSTWEANKVYFTVFENTGRLDDSYRDFHIPMSSKLIGQTVGDSGEQFQGYLQSRFWSWFNANQDCDDECGEGGGDDFANRYMTGRIADIGGLQATAVASPRAWRPGLRQSNMPFDTGLALRSADRRFGMRFGSGDGAAFTGQHGFGMRSDYDVTTGGANPFVGLASGSGYAAVEMAIGDRVTVSTGVSRQDAVMDLDRMSPRERQILGGIDPYRATANTLNVAWRATGKLKTTLGYTLLNEDAALLGVRSLNPDDMRNGSATDAATLGADYAVNEGLSVSLTGTLGRTRPGRGSEGIAVAGGGLVSSAWQVAVAKTGLFDGNDRVRLTMAQPLHVESGRIGFTGVEVIDRRTGELGDVTQYMDFDGGRRRYVAEAMYGRTMADGAAQLSLFGRADLRADDRTQAALTLGGSFRLGF